MAPSHFLPLGPNVGAENTNRRINKDENMSKEYLTMKQANYV